MCGDAFTGLRDLKGGSLGGVWGECGGPGREDLRAEASVRANALLLFSRRARRMLSRSQLRHACRQPCEQIALRRASQGQPQGLLLAPPHPHPSLRMRGPIVIHD